MAKAILHFLAMFSVQLGFSGMNIISTLAMHSGMSPFVHVAYRQCFATLFFAPIAYLQERKTRPPLTFSIMFQIFLCSIFGATAYQITFFVGLNNSTPTIAGALTNIIPAVTFLIAAPLGLETADLRTKEGMSKILGTSVCVGGALLLSTYHGPVLNIGESSIHWKLADKSRTEISRNHFNFMLGPFLLIASSISYAVWLIIQAKVSKMYPAPYSNTALMCLMASIECVAIAMCTDHNISAWSLSPSIKAISSLYAGIVCTALGFFLTSWCIQSTGPLYVSVFNPLQLVITAILSWALLQETLFCGTLLGSILVVIGLFCVLWGKSREKQTKKSVQEKDIEKLSSKEDVPPESVNQASLHK